MPRTPDQIIKRHLHRRVEKRAILIAVFVMLVVLVGVEATAPLPAKNLLAQVGDTRTSASVAENPVNTLNAEFTTLGEELAQREADVVAREIALGIEERQRQNNIMLYVLLGAFALIGINFLFNMLEMHELKTLEHQLTGGS